jgi:hypothetical protein
MSIERLISKQNGDGGWPYMRGKSWTEPTVYAILSLLAAGERNAAQRGIEWLRRTQRADGGWAPREDVEESNWTTALAALLPREALGVREHRGAITWLMGTTGFESSFEFRLRQWLLGNRPSEDMEFAGWPWFPGAAAWVGPTSIAILALEKEHRRKPLIGMRERIEAGRQFLLLRACAEGGWNHGSVRALGYESRPYPETTGMALAALRGVRAPQVDRSVAVARQFLTECRSADAQNWLRLGLLAQASLPPGYCRPQDLSFRTIPETSLDLLMSGAMSGHDLFWC